MAKTLSRIGENLGVIIDGPLLERLGIDGDTVLEVSTDGEALIIRPVRMTRSERIAGAAARVSDSYASAFKELAAP